MFQSMFEAGISNVAVASLMAVIVLAVTRVWKNPHVAHVLWLLVLVKLVSPPLWHISIPVPHAFGSFSESHETANRNRNENPIVSSELDVAKPSSLQPAMPGLDDHVRHPVIVESYSSAPESAQRSEGADSPVDASTASTDMSRTRLPASLQAAPDHTSWWLTTTALLWLAGALVWSTVLGFRVVCLNRRLSQTLPATAELKRVAEMIARQFSLRRMPDVRLTEAVVSPMVWSAALRPMIVLPKQLVDGMDGEQLSAIVAHEFAHLKRRDHWVRFLEFVVVSVYWWNPLVWWARRELHAAEEACCDALVLRMYPDRSAAYGEALLRTNEFVLSGQVPSPVLASGFGRSCSLKRRVEMILKNDFGRPASLVVRLMLAVIAIGILPMAARVLAQDEVLKETPAVKAPTAPGQRNPVTPISTFQRRSTSSNSLEDRVGRIEKLLEQLIKAQESNNPTALDDQLKVLVHVHDPFTGAKARADTKAPPLRRYDPNAALQADELRLPIEVNGEVFSSIKAVENSLVKNQAEIARLRKIGKRLQDALRKVKGERVPKLPSERVPPLPTRR